MNGIWFHIGFDFRSIDDEVFKMPKGPIVIQAQPKAKPKSDLYSVYGSPDINYSALYERPPAAQSRSDNQHQHQQRREFQDGREFFLNSALDSRRADTRDYPLLWPPFHLRREQPNGLEPVESHGGGLQMIKPPNRKKKTTEYFYYRWDREWEGRLSSSFIIMSKVIVVGGRIKSIYSSFIFETVLD